MASHSEKFFVDTAKSDLHRTCLHPFNTKKANAKCSRIFRAYLIEKGLPADFETFNEIALNDALSRFFVDARKSDGERYKSGSFHAIRLGLNRYLKSQPFNKPFDITKDSAFNKANKNFKMTVTEIRKCGLGEVAHHRPITETDRTKLFNSEYMSTKNPLGLYNRVQFYVRLYLCRHGGENMRSMTKSTFVVFRDPKTGLKYVVRQQQKDVDKHLVDIMPETPGSPFCPVALFEKYLSKLHPDCDFLWQRAMSRVRESTNVWYFSLPMGEKVLSGFMTQLSVATKLSHTYSNYSIRNTAASLFSKGRTSLIAGSQLMTVIGQKFVQMQTVHKPVNIATACTVTRSDAQQHMRLPTKVALSEHSENWSEKANKPDINVHVLGPTKHQCHVLPVKRVKTESNEVSDRHMFVDPRIPHLFGRASKALNSKGMVDLFSNVVDKLEHISHKQNDSKRSQETTTTDQFTQQNLIVDCLLGIITALKEENKNIRQELEKQEECGDQDVNERIWEVFQCV